MCELKIGLTVVLWRGRHLALRPAGNYPGARGAPADRSCCQKLGRYAPGPFRGRGRANPFQSSPELLQESLSALCRRCASYHGNDNANAEIGRNLFPRPRHASRTDAAHNDGELYYIIHNGIRWTGMRVGDLTVTWTMELVLFIRHLPRFGPPKLRHGRFNPKSVVDQEEEKRKIS
jgi:hypothetical protein